MNILPYKYLELKTNLTADEAKHAHEYQNLRILILFIFGYALMSFSFWFETSIRRQNSFV
jgi:hypothetical protein